MKMKNFSAQLKFCFLIAISVLVIPVVLAKEKDTSMAESLIMGGWDFKLPNKPSEILKMERFIEAREGKSQNLASEKSGKKWEFFFEGLYVRAYQPDPQTDKCYFYFVEISEPHFPVKFGFNVGTSFEKVVELLGKPKEKAKGVFFYSNQMNKVVFFTEKGIISKIQWEFPQD